MARLREVFSSEGRVSIVGNDLVLNFILCKNKVLDSKVLGSFYCI
jgi:hypothetical protein